MTKSENFKKSLPLFYFVIKDRLEFGQGTNTANIWQYGKNQAERQK